MLIRIFIRSNIISGAIFKILSRSFYAEILALQGFPAGLRDSYFSRDKVGKAKGIHPYRRANLLDAVANSLPAIVPFLSVFVFIGSALTGLSPVAVAGGTLYGFTLFAVMVVAVATGWGRDFEGKNGEAVKQPVEETAQSSK